MRKQVEIRIRVDADKRGSEYTKQLKIRTKKTLKSRNMQIDNAGVANYCLFLQKTRVLGDLHTRVKLCERAHNKRKNNKHNTTNLQQKSKYAKLYEIMQIR